jgi:threonine/homoserine/homoserine lactone efflux protein
VAISPVPIIAVILILFSKRALVNGPVFLLGWVVGLAVVSGVSYAIADAANASTDPGASDAVSWGKIVLGVILVVIAVWSFRRRPAPGEPAELPRWMAGVDRLTPGRTLGLGVLLSALNPKTLLLAIGAGVGLAQLGISAAGAIISLIVLVLLGSLTIAGPVVYYRVAPGKARRALDELKGWLTEHNAAVTTVLFLVFGVVLIARGMAPLTD